MLAPIGPGVGVELVLIGAFRGLGGAYVQASASPIWAGLFRLRFLNIFLLPFKNIYKKIINITVFNNILPFLNSLIEEIIKLMFK